MAQRIADEIELKVHNKQKRRKGSLLKNSAETKSINIILLYFFKGNRVLNLGFLTNHLDFIIISEQFLSIK